MRAELCDAVLDLPGSASILADLARSNLLLVPLDRRGQWYRYHRLFRDMLLAELEHLQPDLLPVLRRRAADWSQRNDLAEEALGTRRRRRGRRHRFPPGAESGAASLQPGGAGLCSSGTSGSMSGAGWARHPAVAGAGCAHRRGMTGRPAEAERWADVADHAGSTRTRRGRGRPCRRGLGGRGPGRPVPARGQADERRGR